MTGSSVFEIQEARRQGWARLVVTGELDSSTALTFRRRLRALRAANTHVCVDLSQLEFIDCAGAQALNDAITQSQEGDWRVEVAPRMSDQAKRFFDLMTAARVATGS
jgi:anti-anti-sigma factor